MTCNAYQNDCKSMGESGLHARFRRPCYCQHLPGAAFLYCQQKKTAFSTARSGPRAPMVCPFSGQTSCRWRSFAHTKCSRTHVVLPRQSSTVHQMPRGPAEAEPRQYPPPGLRLRSHGVRVIPLTSFRPGPLYASGGQPCSITPERIRERDRYWACTPPFAQKKTARG